MANRDAIALALVGAGLLVLLGGGVVAARKITLAIRNNNPGNVEKGLPWKGLDASRSHERFAVFVAPEWGFRAMARILLGDFREGQNTVRSLISEWAPPTENATGAYVAAVARELKLEPDAPFDVRAKLVPLLRAIARHESGYLPAAWTDAVIARGILLERNA